MKVGGKVRGAGGHLRRSRAQHQRVAPTCGHRPGGIDHAFRMHVLHVFTRIICVLRSVFVVVVIRFLPMLQSMAGRFSTLQRRIEASHRQRLPADRQQKQECERFADHSQILQGPARLISRKVLRGHRGIPTHTPIKSACGPITDPQAATFFAAF